MQVCSPGPIHRAGKGIGKRKMKYAFNGYVFDAHRLIIYESGIDEGLINRVNMLLDNENDDNDAVSELENLDAQNMHMSKIAIDKAGICLTYNCNLRCSYCGYSSTDMDKNQLKLSDIEVFIKDIIKKRTIKKLITKKDEPLEITFTGGGEPTYDWDLFVNTVRLIKQLCIEHNIPLILRMTTNGVLSATKIDFISENFSEVMVSYDGMPEIQNQNRISSNGKATNLTVEHSIYEFASRKIPLNIRTTIWQKDYSRLGDMYRYICSLVPPKSIIVWSIYPVLFEGRAIEHIKNQEDITYKTFLDSLIKLLENIVLEEGEDKVKIDVPLFNNELCGIFCGAHRITHPWLLPDKTIVTCIESKENKVDIGKIEEGKMKYYEYYQDNFLEIMQRKYTECRECLAYRFCKGGCPVWHLRVDDERKEPLECLLQREYWKYVLKALVCGKYSFGWYLKRITIPDREDCKIYRIVKKTV